MSDDIQLNPPRSVQPPAAPPEQALDAGSQALSEALRSSFVIVKFVMLALLLVFLCSGFFTVGPQQNAIILRFGKPVGEGEKALLGPGFHWSFPYPIDEYVLVSINGLQQVRSSAGWYATTPAAEAAGTEIPPAPGTPLDPSVDGYVIAADGNIVHTRAMVTYRIKDPVRYVFGFVNASNAVQTAVDDALLWAASHHRVDDMLTRDVIAFNETVRRRATDLIAERDLGVILEQCTVQSIPPRQIKDAFTDVLRAEVNRSKLLTDARSYENQVRSKASADAQSRINVAESDRVRVVNEIASRAEQFRELLPKYRQNPKLFVEQRLLDTIGRTLTNAQDKIYIPESRDGKSKEVRLLFNREPKLKTEENKP